MRNLRDIDYASIEQPTLNICIFQSFIQNYLILVHWIRNQFIPPNNDTRRMGSELKFPINSETLLSTVASFHSPHLTESLRKNAPSKGSSRASFSPFSRVFNLSCPIKRQPHIFMDLFPVTCDKSTLTVTMTPRKKNDGIQMALTENAFGKHDMGTTTTITI